MEHFGSQTTIVDIIRARRQDIMEINSLKTGKLPGRNLTGKRDVPTAVADTDKIGDHFFSATGDLWLFDAPNGVRTWSKFIPDATIT